MSDEPERRWPRRAAIAGSGRHVAIRAAGDIALIDAFGIAQRQALAGSDVIDFAFVGDVLWLLERQRLHRVPLHRSQGLAAFAPIDLPGSATALSPVLGDGVPAAVLHGAPPMFASAAGVKCDVEVIAARPDERVFPVSGRRVILAGERGLRSFDVGRGEVGPLAFTAPGRVLDVFALFSGRALGILTRAGGQDAFLAIKPDGRIIHRVAVAPVQRWAVGATRGIALAWAAPDVVMSIDLRYGRISARTTVPWAIGDLGINSDGQYVVLCGAPGGGEAPVVHAPTTELFGDATRAPTVHPTSEDAPAPVDEPAAPSPELGVGQVLSLASPTSRIDAAALAPGGAAVEQPAPPAIPDLLPIAFGVQPAPVEATADPRWPPYHSAQDHLEELLDLTAARAARAIAVAWHSGLLSVPAEDSRPFEREVRALLGHVGGYAPDQLIDADERLALASARTAGRARSTVAEGRRLPFIDLVREFGLSSVAAQVLVAALAPGVRGQIARLFGILGNDPNRPIVDRYLIEAVVGGSDPQRIAEVAQELGDDAPLVGYGLVRIGAGELGAPLFGAISVEPVLVERLRGRAATGAIGHVTAVRHADRTLDDLQLVATIKRDVVLALAAPAESRAPLRMVMTGRRGSGRHSLIAALAARVGRSIACIDCQRLPRAGKLMARALRQELFRALLRGCVPVVSGIELADPADAEGLDQLKQTLRAHPGPVVIRAAPEASLPVDPGYVSVTLPTLTESERAAFWRRAVDRARLAVEDVEQLAARYRIGPGIIEQVIGHVVARNAVAGDQAAGDAGSKLDEVAAQHIATRLAHVAQHVRRRARFEQVALPEDVIDSIREFIARCNHRKTVYEQWGFDAIVSSARGLTALFYGPPGTGKSMVAGLIARELGLELYRVDLARVVSKWIGETEKNLAEVFDAAEDGHVVVLFDEADSLFARRTAVKSSVDRYANLEVNYLLQRLDTFEGICILATNLEGSVDPAFRRRMSLRLNFPFPDEDTRVRLWSAHIPPEVPVQNDFDFAELARRFPMSGGYIRNSTLRAAFLAAQEDRPLSQSHLLRAIALEYRELGKLSNTGRIE